MGGRGSRQAGFQSYNPSVAILGVLDLLSYNVDGGFVVEM